MSNSKIFKILIKPKKAHAEAGNSEIILFSDSFKFAKDAQTFGSEHLEKIGEDAANWFAPKPQAGTEQQFAEWKANNPDLAVSSVSVAGGENQKEVEQAQANEESASSLIDALKDDAMFADIIEAFGGEGVYLPIIKKNILNALSEVEQPGHYIDISELISGIEDGEIDAQVFANPKMFAEHFEQMPQIDIAQQSTSETEVEQIQVSASDELKQVCALVCLFDYDPENPYSEAEKSDAIDLTNNQNCSEEEFAAYEKLAETTSAAIDGLVFDFDGACNVASAISKEFGQGKQFDAIVETAKSFAAKVLSKPKVESTANERLAERFESVPDHSSVSGTPEVTGEGTFEEIQEGEQRQVIAIHYLEAVKNYPIYVESYESTKGRFMAIAHVCRPGGSHTQKSGGWFDNINQARSEAWGIAVSLIQSHAYEFKLMPIDIAKSMIKGIAQRPVDNMDSLLVDADTLAIALERSKNASAEPKQEDQDNGEMNQAFDDAIPANEKAQDAKSESKPTEKKETAADRKKREKAEAEKLAEDERKAAAEKAEKEEEAKREEFNAELSKLNERINALLPGEHLVIEGLSDSLYHASEGWSKSSLDTINRDPSLVVWQKDAPVDETKLNTFEVGKALHTLVLEPHKFGDEYAVAPVLNMRTNDGKAQFKKFYDDNKDKIVLSGDDARMVDFMARSVMAHPTAKKLFSAEDGKAEVSIWWRDPESSIVFKCRPDWMCTVFGQKFIVDLKSVANVWDFEKSCENFRYHVQDAHYSWIYENVFGTMPIFAFCAVSKSIECGRYPVRLPILDDSDKQDGKDELDKNIETLRECLESNIWGGFETITRPHWAKRNK